MFNNHGVYLIQLNGIIIHKSYIAVCSQYLKSVSIWLSGVAVCIQKTAVFWFTSILYEVKIKSPHKPETQEVK